MADPEYRVEHDSMGEVRVPAGALWGAQTQRAIANFSLSGLRMPRGLIRALALIKWAAARANVALAGLEPRRGAAIERAALAVAGGAHDQDFPLDVFQTGSGTSTNMNVNEVVARLASIELGSAVHPNDDVNRSQSSNDCVPSAIHVAAALALEESLLPALHALAAIIDDQARVHAQVVKTGRTHLMDAMPLTVGQEFGAWRAQIIADVARLEATRPRVLRLAQGATAIGSGVNAPAGFGAFVARELAVRSGLAFAPADDLFAALACQDTTVELSGQLRVLAVSLLKIANDLRWMNSGPLAGLGEITLPALQPGSSIMPGKVNPVIPEAVAMAAVQVIGHDAAIALAGSSGSFQLNVMLPLIAHDLLESMALLASAARALGEQAIQGLKVNAGRLAESVERNPILVTALNALIGYEQGAAVAKAAYASGRPILDVAVEFTGRPRAELAALLDPVRLTRAGGG